jgi:hypothetical protein
LEKEGYLESICNKTRTHFIGWTNDPMFLDKRKYYTKEYNIFELLEIFHN